MTTEQNKQLDNILSAVGKTIKSIRYESIQYTTVDMDMETGTELSEGGVEHKTTFVFTDGTEVST